MRDELVEREWTPCRGDGRSRIGEENTVELRLSSASPVAPEQKSRRIADLGVVWRRIRGAWKPRITDRRRRVFAPKRIRLVIIPASAAIRARSMRGPLRLEESTERQSRGWREYRHPAFMPCVNHEYRAKIDECTMVTQPPSVRIAALQRTSRRGKTRSPRVRPRGRCLADTLAHTPSSRARSTATHRFAVAPREPSPASRGMFAGGGAQRDRCPTSPWDQVGALQMPLAVARIPFSCRA